MEKTEFKLVRILNEYEVVIDGGYLDGIDSGDLFQIYTEGEPIYDTENPSQILGTLDVVKATVYAKSVNPNLTICRNNQTSHGGLSINLSPEVSSLLNTFIPTTQPLKVDPAEVQETAIPSDSTIKIGDLVRKLPKKP